MQTKFLSRKDVPNHYPVSFAYLARLASRGLGPRYHIVANKAQYKPSDIEEWLETTVVKLRRKENFNRGRPRKTRSTGQRP